MPFLPYVLVAQLIFSLLIVNLSPNTLTPIKHDMRNVLGVQITQETTIPTDQPTPPPESNSQPVAGAPENPPPPESTPAPTTQETPSSSQPSASPQTPEATSIPEPTQATPLFATQPEPSSTPATNQQPTNTQPEFTQQMNNLNQIIEVSPVPTEAASPSPSAAPPNLANEQLQQTISQTQAVLNPEELTSSPESINPKSVDEAKKEEETLNQITDPKKQTAQLIINSVDKIKDINENIIKADFSTANFASQRFNDQINRALDNLQSLPTSQANLLKSQVITFCNQADLILRNAQLSVPEDLEQDLEINRAKCLETQL